MPNDKKLLQKLGKRIKEVRKSQGLTQEQLAELCEYDPTYISLLERGGRNPPFLTLCLLAKNLDCKIRDLFQDFD